MIKSLSQKTTIQKASTIKKVMDRHMAMTRMARRPANGL